MADEQVVKPKTELLEQLSHLHITEPQPIRLICEGCEYILFHPTQQQPEEEDQTILLTEPEYKELYFAPLQQLIQALHHIFPNLHNQHKNELVLNFTTLEIRVPEDNIYSKELSLFDIDRLHIGANLPDRLLISLENQPRLAHRFNILATFVSQLDHPQEQEEEEGEAEPELSTEDQQDLQFQDEPENDSQEAFTTQDDPPLTSPNNLTAYQNPELILTTSTTTHLPLETATPIIQPPSSEKDEQSATTTITTATSLPLVSPPDHCSSSSSLLLPPVASLDPENDEPELVGDDLGAPPDTDDLESGQFENIVATVDDYLPPEETEAVEADQPEYDLEQAVSGYELASGELELNLSAAVPEAELEVPLNDATATGELEHFEAEGDLADSALEFIDEENHVRDADRTGSLQPAAVEDDHQTISESQSDLDQLVSQATESLHPPFDQANLILTANDVIACSQSPAEELTHHQDNPSSEFPPHYESNENLETNDQVVIESESNLDVAANASFPESALEEYVEENWPDFAASCSQSDLTLNGFEHVSEGQVEEQTTILTDDTYIHREPENYDIELLSCSAGVVAAADDDDDDVALKTATSDDHQLSNSPETTFVSIGGPVPQLGSKRSHTEVEHDLELDPISRSLIEFPDYLLDVKKTRTV